MKFGLNQCLNGEPILTDDNLIKLKTPDGGEWDDWKQTRLSFAESDDPAVLEHLITRYWRWHLDASLSDAVRTLLTADLGWEKSQDLMTPPVGEVISPLGHALDSTDGRIREAAFQVLDAMVEVPAGSVLIGDELTPLQVSAFQISRYPVTNAQYQRFVRETGHHPPQSWEGDSYPEKKGDHPAVWVNFEDAEAYAEWTGCRLPTFEEWTRAARGDDGRRFPWGNEIDKPRCNTAELGARGTTPVCAFPDGVSPVGCYDMMGNVWEWTDTWYDEEERNFRVVCGGAWYYNHDASTCASFDYFSVDYTELIIGFRVAR